MGGFITFLVALAVTTILIPPLTRIAAPLKFIDLPDFRKAHTGAVPRIGGVAILLGSLAAILIGLDVKPGILAFLASIVVLSVFGLLDDRFDLNPRTKLLGQLIAAAIVVIWGDLTISRLPFIGDSLPPIASVPLTILVLLVTTNAINLSDGLDGLAGGVALLTLGTIAMLAQLAQAWHVVILAIAVIGSILGFLRYNTHPATVFMGDTGSQFLGFAVGVLSIELTQQAAPALSAVLPLMLLGLPIVDTFMVMVLRLRQGKSPFSADRNHIHHKLLQLGFEHYEAVGIIYLVQALFLGAAFGLRYQEDVLVLVVYLAISAFVALAFHVARTMGWRVRSDAIEKQDVPLTRRMLWLRSGDRLSRWALAYVGAVVAAYLAIAIVHAQRISSDVGIMALGLGGVAAIWCFLRRDIPLTNSERIVIYVICVVGVYLMQTNPPLAFMRGKTEQVLFMTLVIASSISLRYSSAPTGFRFTPLDILVLPLVLILPQVFDLGGHGNINWPLALAKLVVMFYAVELFLAKLKKGWWFVRVVMIILLFSAGLKGVAGY